MTRRSILGIWTYTLMMFYRTWSKYTYKYRNCWERGLKSRRIKLTTAKKLPWKRRRDLWKVPHRDPKTPPQNKLKKQGFSRTDWIFLKAASDLRMAVIKRRQRPKQFFSRTLFYFKLVTYFNYFLCYVLFIIWKNLEAFVLKKKFLHFIFLIIRHFMLFFVSI